MFAGKKNKAIDAFAGELAELLASRVPPGEEGRATEKKSARRLGRTLDEIYVRASEFRTEQRLGVYGKARLGNAFKWALKEKAYGEAFVDEVTKGLVVQLSGR